MVWREKEKYVTKLWPQTWPDRLKKFADRKNFDKMTLGKLLLIFGGMIVVMRFALPLLNYFVASGTGVAPSVPGNEAEQLWKVSPFLLLFVGVVSPVFEEWLTRATLYDYLRDNWHRYGGMLLSSGSWALFHWFRSGFTWTSVFAPFFAGFLLCWVYDRAGFGGVVLVHSGNNLLAWLAVFL